jgi:hypothetical protein
MISYLEVEDDGPDEAESQFGISVDDVLASDIDLNSNNNMLG